MAISNHCHLYQRKGGLAVKAIDILALCIIFVLGLHGHILTLMLVGLVYAIYKLTRKPPSTKLDSRSGTPN